MIFLLLNPLILTTMKKTILNLLAASAFVVFIASCENQASGESDLSNEIPANAVHNDATGSGEQVDPEKAPQMTFEKEVHDFGDIVEGEKVEYSFKFTNTGKSDLLISSANASCGCTIPHFPDEPIAPGGTGTIDVIFNSSGKDGKIDKKITILANTVPNRVVIKITGTVKPA